MPSTIKVYTLSDPRRPDEVRYVGKTKTPTRRLSRHLSERSKTWKCYWVQKLLREGVTPKMEIVGKYTNPETANRAEQLWILACRVVGDRLTNATCGGEGPTPEAINKLSEHGKKRCRSKKGREEMRRRALMNKSSRREHLAKQTTTAKYKKAVSEARRRKWTDPEYRETMSRMSSETWQTPEIAESRMKGIGIPISEKRRLG